MRILIADDELMSRRLLEKTMQRARYEVTAIANGQLAAAELPAFGLARAEKIRQTIAERPGETSAGSVSISMSFGLLLS